MKKLKYFLLGLVLFIPGLAFIYSDEDNFELAKNLDIFYTLIKELNTYYVDDAQPGVLIKTGIDAMLESLDPYTVYIPESKIEEFKFMTTGNYGGVGALMMNRNNEIVITDLYQGSPIDSAGIKTGDAILEINGQSVSNKSSETISELLKGQPGTKVVLSIKRPDLGTPLQKTVYRKKIQISNVTYYGLIKPKVGYIKLTGFMEDASLEVKKAFIDLRDNKHIESVILDLRDNPGGLLIEAVNIVNIFVEKGQHIVSTKGKVKIWNKEFNTTASPIDIKMPVIVIVNSSSASASEIVAGAIQDIDRGVILGQRTYGKGLVQIPRPLSYNAQLKVTTAKYYIPSGRCIQALDYTHRNPDGSVGKIPDSLITKFKTKSNRTVYDGGGILPDVETNSFKSSLIAYNLIEKLLVFDYATLYASKNKSIIDASQFSISDKEYTEFISFLESKNFDYNSKTEQYLEKLKDIASSEQVFTNAKEEFEILRNKLKHNKNTDLKRFKKEISELLNEEISSRFYYQKGRIENSLTHDGEVLRALEILANPVEYNQILTPKIN